MALRGMALLPPQTSSLRKLRNIVLVKNKFPPSYLPISCSEWSDWAS